MSFDGTLADWLREQPGLLSLQQVVYVVRKTADALQQLHNRQVVYQDLNLSSFLIHASAKDAERFDLQLVDPGTPGHTSTRADIIYMAPEQWIGQIMAATDQYALAVIAYELLTGLPPFQGPPVKLMELHLNIQPPAPSSLNPRVSPAIDAVILNALAKRPEDRFPSVFAFARALEQAVQYPESLIMTLPKRNVDGSLHATLPISRAEAAMGTLRTITLPQGQRITVPVPQGAYDGQIIRLEGLGDSSSKGGPAGTVLLTIAVTPTETSIFAPSPMRRLNTPAPSPTNQPTMLPVVVPISAPLTNFRTRVYTIVAGLSPRRRAVLLTSLVLILLLGSGGFFFFLQTSAGMPIPYPPYSGSLAFTDPLRDNTGGYGWPTDTASDGSACQFTQGAYHASTTRAGSFRYCIAGSSGFSDFAYEVQVTIIKGDGGGLIFRADGANNKFYYFRIGRDGSYGLYRYIDTVGTHAQTLASGITPAIHTGLNHPNLLAVVAHGSAFDLYVNNQRIASASDNTYGYGQVGVAAAYITGLTEVAFSNAKVWTL